MKQACFALLCVIAVAVTVTLAQQPGQPAQSAQPQPADDDSLYEIRDDVMIRTGDGATLSAIVIRQKGLTGRLPAVFTLDIYTNPDLAKVCPS